MGIDPITGPLYALWSAISAPVGWAAKGVGAVGSATGVSATEAAALGLGAGAVGVQMQAQGQAQEAQNRALEFQAQQAAINAAIAEREGEVLTRRHAAEQQLHRRRVLSALGEQRAAVGGSGVQVGVGSPLAVSQAIVDIGFQDALALREIQGIERFNIGMKAQQATQRGILYRAQKGSARGAQFGTFLTGASKLTEQFQRYRGDLR